MNRPAICPTCFQPNEALRTYCWKCSQSLTRAPNTEDYLRFFNLHPSASRDDLKATYHQLATKFHPDKNPGDGEAEARFKFVAMAYEALLPVLGGKAARSSQQTAPPSPAKPAGHTPEVAKIVEQQFAAFLADQFTGQGPSLRRTYYRQALLLGAIGVALRDLVYGLSLYQSRSMKGFDAATFHHSLGMVLAVLAMAIALIGLAYKYRDLDIIPSATSLAEAQIQVYGYVGWILVWGLLLFVIPVVLQTTLAPQ